MTETPPQPAASVLLLCGLPASGKSTFARTIIDLQEQHRCKLTEPQECDSRESTNDDVNGAGNIPIVEKYDRILLIDYDSITQQELTARCDQRGDVEGIKSGFDASDLEAWRRSRVCALEILEKALTAHFLGGNGTSSLLIIMDDNFHLRSMRRDVYRLCQDKVPQPSPDRCDQAQIGFCTFYFSTPVEICLQRNALREGKANIPVDVINRMAAAMEPPDETKPYASFERFHISVDNSDQLMLANMNGEGRETLQEMAACLDRSLQSPIVPRVDISLEEIAQLEQQRLRQREETLKCQGQRIDQLLRKLVGAVGRVERKRSKEANETRKSILESTRKRDDLAQMTDHSVVQAFTCSILNVGENDLKDLDSPIATSIKETYQQFQKERDHK